MKNSILKQKRNNDSRDGKVKKILKKIKYEKVEASPKEVLNGIKIIKDNVQKPSFMFILKEVDRKKYTSEENDNSIQKAYYASKIGEQQTLMYKDIVARRYGNEILHNSKFVSASNELLGYKIKKTKPKLISTLHEEDVKIREEGNIEDMINDITKQKVKLLNNYSEFKEKMKKRDEKRPRKAGVDNYY